MPKPPAPNPRPLAPDPLATEPLAPGHWTMAAIIIGITLAGLDGAIANIALPTIARELQSSEAATVWVVNAYTLTVTMLLLPAAALGESLGLKRVYAFGLIVFTLASLICAIAPSLPVLVAARALQGVGGACMSALGGALVRGIYPRARLGEGFALIALFVAISAAAGPTLAALILAVAPWPWLFLVNVPIGLAAIALYLAKAPPSPGRPRKLDIPGALLAAAALGLLVVGVDNLGGPARPFALAEVAAGLLCAAALVRQQSSRQAPLLPLDLLRIPLFALSVATSITAYAAQILAYVSLPFLFQSVMHRSTFATGLLVTPWPLLVAFAAPLAGRLSARHPAAILGSIGMAILATGLVALALMPALPQDWDIAWRMGLCGIGFGFYQTPNNLTLMTAGPPARSGAASGMQAVSRTLGWSLGTALVAMIFSLEGGQGAVACLWTAAAIAATGAALSVARTGTPAR